MTPSQDPQRYRSYLLRLWWVASTGLPSWRASLEDTRTGERHNFSNLTDAFAFLEGQTGALLPAALQPPSLTSDKETLTMTTLTSLGALHHLALTVTDVARSREFYTNVLGFQFLMDLGPRVLLNHNGLIVALRPPNDAPGSANGDRFDENRLGLDHLSFGVADRAEMEKAVRLFDERKVPHGEIRDLNEFGLPIYVMAFRDPDNIQVELTAPRA